MKTSEIRLTLLADSQSSSAFTVVEDSPTFLATSVSYSIVSCRVSLPCSAATERALPSNAGDMLMLSVAWARKLANQSCKEFRVCTPYQCFGSEQKSARRGAMVEQNGVQAYIAPPTCYISPAPQSHRLSHNENSQPNLLVQQLPIQPEH